MHLCLKKKLRNIHNPKSQEITQYIFIKNVQNVHKKLKVKNEIKYKINLFLSYLD